MCGKLLPDPHPNPPLILKERGHTFTRLIPDPPDCDGAGGVLVFGGQIASKYGRGDCAGSISESHSCLQNLILNERGHTFMRLIPDPPGYVGRGFFCYLTDRSHQSTDAKMVHGVFMSRNHVYRILVRLSLEKTPIRST